MISLLLSCGLLSLPATAAPQHVELKPTFLSAPKVNLIDLKQADLNQDGLVDLVCFDKELGVTWHQNQNDGPFVTHHLPSPIHEGEFVWPADLDGDGDLDLVTAGNKRKPTPHNRIYIFENLGGGEFARVVEVQRPEGSCYGITTADLDGDGLPELIGNFREPARVGIFKNLGSLSFDVEEEVTSEFGAFGSISAGDIDQDGDNDLAISFDGLKTLRWFENAGDGSFSGEHEISGPTWCKGPNRLADLNGDGWLDIVLLDDWRHGQEVMIYFNQTDGTFSSPEQYFPGKPRHLDLADADQDGDLDLLLMIDRPYPRMGWMLNNGFGQFGNIQLADYEWTRLPVVAADIDGNGYPDPVCPGREPSLIRWIPNGPQGHGVSRDALWHFEPDISIATNFNLDNQADVVTLTRDGDLFLAAGTSKGLITPVQLDRGGPTIQDIHYADINADGFVDIIGAGIRHRGIYWFEQTSDLEFAPPQPLNFFIEPMNILASGDLNGDGLDDLLASGVGDNLYWFQNDGANRMLDPVIIDDVNKYVEGAFLADLDRDGDLDIVTNSRASRLLLSYENDGHGNWNTPQVIDSDFFGFDTLVPWDVNQDGYTDLLGADRNDLIWFANEQGMNFGSRQLIHRTINGSYNSLAQGDFDFDGDLDIGAISSDPELPFAFFFNQNNQFNGPVYPIGNVNKRIAGQLLAANFDGDGDVDLLAESLPFQSLLWVQNPIHHPPKLASTQLRPNRVATLTVSGATPQQRVWFGYSLTGGGPTWTPHGDLLLTEPYFEIDRPRANKQGVATVDVLIPPRSRGIPVWMHAYDETTLVYTNGLMEVIQ